MDRILPILAYHKVDPRGELGVTWLSPRRFERQIGFLKNEGYTSISPELLTDDMTSSQKPVLITFDDGYEGVYTYAYPILKKHSSTAIIFITTGYIGRNNDWDKSPGPRFRHLSWAHIREMSEDGIQFGSHGVNHTFLTRQSDSKVRYEIEASKKTLEDNLGQPVNFFSYPYGDYDDRVINFVREAGYKAAFSLRPELLRAGQIGAAMYALPRVAIYFLDNMRAFRAKVGCAHSESLARIQRLKNRVINRCAYASALFAKSRS